MRSIIVVNMAIFIFNASLCIFSILILSVVANVMKLAPLCGTMDGSPKKDSDKIYFIDKTEPVRKVEVNGTIYGCYPDGTMIKTNSSSPAENNGKKTVNRISNGDHPFICLSLPIILKFFFHFQFQ